MLAISAVLEKYKPHVRFFVVAVKKHGRTRHHIEVTVTVDPAWSFYSRLHMRRELWEALRVADLSTIASDFGLPDDPCNPPTVYIDIRLANMRPE